MDTPSDPHTPATPGQPGPADARDALGERFGNDGLQHLVYVSKASPDNKPETLTDILKVSRHRNRAAGITGLLVYFDGRFLQYLEGPALAVAGTLGLIRTDRRHRDFELLLDEPTDKRLFRAWDMGCLDVGSEGWLKLVEADWPTIRPVSRNAPSGLAVLQELAAQPAEPVDRIRVLGGAPKQEAPIVVAETAPELRAVRLQLAAAVLVAVGLAAALLYEWLK